MSGRGANTAVVPTERIADSNQTDSARAECGPAGPWWPTAVAYPAPPPR